MIFRDVLRSLLVGALVGWCSAAGTQAATLVIERAPSLRSEGQTGRAGQTVRVPLVERDGERWVPLQAGLEAAVRQEIGVEIQSSFVILARPGLSLKLAAGLNWGIQGRTVVWLPEPLRWMDGLPVVSPRSLARILTALDIICSLEPAGKRLHVKRVNPVTSQPRNGGVARVVPSGSALAPPAPRPPAPRPAAAAGPYHVVLDAGHGGNDCGARGRSKLCEKEVTLDLTLRLEKLLRKEGWKVTLTRRRDTYVGLKERVRITRKSKADLFVSIHVNSATNRAARGVETYVWGYHALAGAQAAMVERENKAAPYLDNILSDLQQRQHHEVSVQVAGAVEEAMVRKLKLIGRARKRVFEAPFYVLAGVKRPAVLIEVGFISNVREERRLRTRQYRRQLAESIAAGLRAARKLQPAG